MKCGIESEWATRRLGWRGQTTARRGLYARERRRLVTDAIGVRLFTREEWTRTRDRPLRRGEGASVIEHLGRGALTSTSQFGHSEKQPAARSRPQRMYMTHGRVHAEPPLAAKNSKAQTISVRAGLGQRCWRKLVGGVAQSGICGPPRSTALWHTHVPACRRRQIAQEVTGAGDRHSSTVPTSSFKSPGLLDDVRPRMPFRRAQCTHYGITTPCASKIRR